MNTNKMMRGAVLLTVAGLIGKILSATYRIPLQNLTGDIGFYIYQQMYPLIGISMVLALYGYPQAISKLVAERKNRGLVNNLPQVYVPVTLILILLNLLFAVLLYTLAPHLASLIGDQNLTGIYRAATSIFILLPFLAVLRGTFQGHEQMLPTAISQVVEQVIRALLIIVGSYLIFTERLDKYAIGYIGVIASVIGMGIAMIGWLFFARRCKQPVKGNSTPVPWHYYIRTIISLGIIAAMGHVLLLLLQVVDVVTIVPALLRAGLSETVAMASKGIFDRGQPLIQFGAVFGSSFALALVPSVVKGMEDRQHAIREALQFGLYLAGAASVGLMLLMPQVNRLLFMTTDETASLRILMISIVLTALSITIASVLQNMGHVHMVAWCMLTAVGVKGLLNVLLIPHIYLIGSALGTVISLALLLSTLLIILYKKMKKADWITGKQIAFFVLAAGVMSGFIVLLQYLIPTQELSRFGLFWFVMGAVASGAFLYMSILMLLQAFSEQQLQALPFGHRIIAFHHWVQQKKRG